MENFEARENGYGDLESRKQAMRLMLTTIKLEIGEEVIVFDRDEIEKIVSDERLLGYKPITLAQRIVENFSINLANFWLKSEEWKEMVVKQPSLFTQSPETINRNIEEAAKLLGLNKEEYVKVAVKQPQLFAQSPETINRNIEEAAKLLGLNNEEYVKVAVKQPQLFYRSPETIWENFKAAAITYENDWLVIRNKVKKNPGILTYSRERNFQNFLAKQITDKQFTWSKNPMKFVEERYLKGEIDGMTVEGLDLLKRALDKYTEMSRED